MKYTVCISVLLLTVVCGIHPQDEASLVDLRVSVINTDDLMQESAMGQKMIADLEKIRSGLEREINKSQEELLKAVETLQKKANTLSVKALEKAQEQLLFLQQTLEAKVEEANKKMAQANKAAQDTFIMRAQSAIADCIAAHDLDVLLDTAHNPIAHLSDRAQKLLAAPDITQEVIHLIDIYG